MPLQVNCEDKVFDDRQDEHVTDTGSGTAIAGKAFKGMHKKGLGPNVREVVFSTGGINWAEREAVGLLGEGWALGMLTALLVNIAEALTCAMFRTNILFAGLNVVAGGHVFGRATYRMYIIMKAFCKTNKQLTLEEKQQLADARADLVFAGDVGVLVSFAPLPAGSSNGFLYGFWVIHWAGPLLCCAVLCVVQMLLPIYGENISAWDLYSTLQSKAGKL
jgi:hypothetical protein